MLKGPLLAWQGAPGPDLEEAALGVEDRELGWPAEEGQVATVHLSLTLSTAPLRPEQLVENVSRLDF